MKRSKFTEQQIAFALKQAELGTTVDEVCRKLGISDATFYNWKKKYGGLGPAELRRLRQLEEEQSSRSSSRICRWIKSCCRMSSQKSSEAFSPTPVNR